MSPNATTGPTGVTKWDNEAHQWDNRVARGGSPRCDAKRSPQNGAKLDKFGVGRKERTVVFMKIMELNKITIF